VKKSKIKASLANIARLAGVSTAAVSFALQNQPGVSPATRERIWRIAKKLGYAPDARIANWMARVRDAKSKDLLPIAWLNTSWQKDAWRTFLFHTPYLNGAEARALELGYKIEEIWFHEPGMTMQRLSKILYQRGIEGVIVTHPARHLRLDWKHLASVSLGASLLAPRLHRVMADLNFNLLLALKSLKRLGYRRIGIALTQELDSASHYTLRATVRDLYFNAPAEERIPPLFHSRFAFREKDSYSGTLETEAVAWIRQYRPEVVVGHDGRLVEWVEKAGYRVPADIGVVHLALDDDASDWAGIHSRRREVGATAVEWLVSLMRNRQFGVPKTPLNISVRGSWQMGKTLRAERRKIAA
jgi:LacI family transcriptional regulator